MSENPYGNNGTSEEPVGANGGTQSEGAGGFTGGIPGSSETSGAKSTVEGSWQEVGQQFKVLGESIAQAMRAAWSNEETQRQLREMRSGLESMVNEVGKAINESTSSPQGQKIKAEASRAAENLKSASQQTVQEVRPHLVNTLKQLNEELQKLIDRWESKNPQ